MKKIIQDSQLYLLELIHNDNIVADLKSLPIWHMSLEFSPYLLVLVKGIIPQQLYLFVKNAMGTKDLILATLSSFMNFIFEYTQQIWVDRCTQQTQFEKANNINLKT